MDNIVHIISIKQKVPGFFFFFFFHLNTHCALWFGLCTYLIVDSIMCHLSRKCYYGAGRFSKTSILQVHSFSQRFKVLFASTIEKARHCGVIKEGVGGGVGGSPCL